MPGQSSKTSVNVRIAGRCHPPLSEMVTSYERIYGGNAQLLKAAQTSKRQYFRHVQTPGLMYKRPNLSGMFRVVAVLFFKMKIQVPGAPEGMILPSPATCNWTGERAHTVWIAITVPVMVIH